MQIRLLAIAMWDFRHTTEASLDLATTFVGSEFTRFENGRHRHRSSSHSNCHLRQPRAIRTGGAVHPLAAVQRLSLLRMAEVWQLSRSAYPCGGPSGNDLRELRVDTRCTPAVLRHHPDEPTNLGDCEMAREVFTAAGDRASAARVVNLIGVANAMAGDFEAAETNFEDALRTFEEVGDHRGVADQLLNLGNIMEEEPEQMISYYRQSLQAAMEIGDRSKIAHAFNNIGVTLEENGDLAGALETHETALAYWTDLGETRNVATVLFNIGQVLHKQESLDLARTKYEESLQMSREAGDSSNVAEVLSHLGGLYMDQGDLDGAKVTLDEALALYRDLEERTEEARVLRSLGGLLDRRGDEAGAQRLYEQAAAIEREIEDKN